MTAEEKIADLLAKMTLMETNVKALQTENEELKKRLKPDATNSTVDTRLIGTPEIFQWT